MSNNSGEIWVNIETGKPHGGDQLPGDREATPEEYDRFLERDFVGIKEKKSQELKAIRDQKEAGGFFYLGKILDSDSNAVQRITTTAQSYMVGKMAGKEMPGLTWTTKDNELLPLSADELIGMPMALTFHASKVHEIYNQLKIKIAEAETIEQLDQINWPEEVIE